MFRLMQMCEYHIGVPLLSSNLTTNALVDLSERPLNRGAWCHLSSTMPTLSGCDSTGFDWLCQSSVAPHIRTFADVNNVTGIGLDPTRQNANFVFFNKHTVYGIFRFDTILLFTHGHR